MNLCRKSTWIHYKRGGTRRNPVSNFGIIDS